MRRIRIALSIAAGVTLGSLAGMAKVLPDGDVLRTAVTGAQIIVPAVVLHAGDKDAFMASTRCRCPTPLPYDDFPQHLIDALIATEDRRFLLHRGVDPFAIVRAALSTFSSANPQGASTLSQQIAKNLVVGQATSLFRKIREMIVARRLERLFTKREIIALYLNQMVFADIGGRKVVGIEQAAHSFYGKVAREITVYEAAQAVGVLQATTAFSPMRNPERSHRRAQHVLARMVREGLLSAQDAAAALKTGSQGRGLPPMTVPARYYLDWSYGELRRIARERSLKGDVRFIIGLDPATQLRAQRLITGSVAAAGVQRVGQGALVAMRPDGQMVALVGGHDFSTSQLNRAVALRQPASAFKVFVYAAALEAGLSPTSLVADRPIRGAWPRNVDGECSGRSVTTEEAFSRSLNCPAVQLAVQLGPATIAAWARELGITSDLRLDPSIALGTSELNLLELTAGYATFASDGQRVRPHAVVLALGALGQVAYTAPDKAEHVVSEQTTRGMRQMLRVSVTKGSSTGAALPNWPSYGKTGTSDGNRDAWFVGFTDELVAGVWVGNDNGSPMLDVTGSGLPATIWRRLQVRREYDHLRRMPTARPMIVATEATGSQ